MNQNPKATLRLVFTNEFGDVTDVTKTLSSETFEDVYPVIRECLMAIGYSHETIDGFMPEVL